MEISLLSKGAIRIKGKTATFILNPSESLKEYNGALYLQHDQSRAPIYEGGITIDGPGEFEIGGVKIKGVRNNGDVTFSLSIDDIMLLIGSLSVFEKVHGKLQEHEIALIDVDKLIDPSFVSALTTSGVIYFGSHADEFNKTFLKGESQSMSKFSSTKEKLPQEMITILLQ